MFDSGPCDIQISPASLNHPLASSLFNAMGTCIPSSDIVEPEPELMEDVIEAAVAEDTSAPPAGECV